MELKFRAWNGKEMSEPFTFDIIKLHFDGPNVYHCIEEYRPLSKHSDRKGLMRWLIDSDVGETVLMQFIGEHDSSETKTEIYKGDIVSFAQPFKFVQAVNFENGEWLVGAHSLHGTLRMYDGLVIGNIYENPELLKEGEV